jgi:hypothetical protein
MSTTRGRWGLFLIAPIALADPAGAAAQPPPASAESGFVLRLEARTERLAPDRVTSPVGLVLDRRTVVRADLRAPVESVLFLAELREGRVVWQAESRPFRLDVESARVGTALGRLLPGGPQDARFDGLRDRVATHYAIASGTVSASAVASSPAEVLLGAVFDHVPLRVQSGRVLIVAVLPASAAQRLAAPVRPMLIGGL